MLYSLEEFLYISPSELEYQPGEGADGHFDNWVFWSQNNDEFQGVHSLISKGITHTLQQLQSTEWPWKLIQFWALKRTGEVCFLATSDQPFGLINLNKTYCDYRKQCMSKRIYICREGGQRPDPVGGAFCNRQPELSGVRLYSLQEIQDHARSGESSGVYSLPLFIKQGEEQKCVGLLELWGFPESPYNNSYLAFLAQELEKASPALYLRYFQPEDVQREEFFAEATNSSYDDKVDAALVVNAIEGSSSVTQAENRVKTKSPKTQVKGEKRKRIISIDDLIPYCEGTMNHAVKCLNDGGIKVSLSTVKRVTQDEGGWRNILSKMKKTNKAPQGGESSSSVSGRNPPCLSLSPQENVNDIGSVTLHGNMTQDAKTVIINASDGNCNIMFELHCESKLAKLKKKVAKRLKLQGRKFSIRYQDKEGWIDITCNPDLQLCMKRLMSSQETIIRMLVSLDSN